MNTLCELINTFPQRDSKQIAIQYKNNDEWKSLSWLQYYNSIVSIACSLKKLGFKKNTRAIIISNTRWEWSVLDFAIMGLQG